MPWSICIAQVTTSLTASPSNTIMIPNVAISINTGAISGLVVTTNYSYTINPGSGAGNCLYLGLSGSNGALAAQTPAPTSSVQYAAVGTQRITVVVYPAALCVPGKAAPAYGTVATATTDVEVSGKTPTTMLAC